MPTASTKSSWRRQAREAQSHKAAPEDKPCAAWAIFADTHYHWCQELAKLKRSADRHAAPTASKPTGFIQTIRPSARKSGSL
jgi:hypothetical protein